MLPAASTRPNFPRVHEPEPGHMRGPAGSDGRRTARGIARRLGQIGLFALLVAGCANVTPPTREGGEDPFDQIHYASYATMDPATRGIRTHGVRHRARWFFQRRKTRQPRPPVRLQKIGRVLDGWTHSRVGQRVQVLITFRDTVVISQFPKPGRRLMRGPSQDSTIVDSLLNTIRGEINKIEGRRQNDYDAETADLQANFGATVLRRHWLSHTMLVEMPVGNVGALALRPNVVYLRANVGRPPPSSAYSPTVADGRAAIGSDHYKDMGAGTGWLAILDTGVNTYHDLLAGDSGWNPFCMVANCTEPGICDPSNATAWQCPWFGLCECDQINEGHGTSTAAILVGNSSQTAAYEGMTRASMDCFNVYDSDGTLNPTAAVDGLQYAIARGNSVIIAEMDEETIGDIAEAADNAYTAGAVVVAANGNEAGWIGQPAKQRRVLAVGDTWLSSGDQVPMGGRPGGSTGDGRIKPDVLAPSYTYTASAASNTALHRYTATSGATPYAGGAALLLRDWMTDGTMGNDVGHVMAHMILCGSRNSPYAENEHEGAGAIVLPPSGQCTWGKSWVTPDADAEVELEVPSGISQIDVAIWWPEETLLDPEEQATMLLDTHNDLDFELVSPGWFGSVKASADGTVGVFERATYSGTIDSGTWLLRIKPKTLVNEAQRVFYAVSMK